MQSWRFAEATAKAELAQIRELAERYSASDSSLEEHCGRAARAFDLTRREEEILRLLLEGNRQQDIARELVVSTNTVKTHTRNLYRKLDVQTKESLAEKVAAATSAIPNT